MNQFIANYIGRLKGLSSDDDLVALYHWFWDNQDAIKQTADEINRTLQLDGEVALKADLPCQSIGSRKGLLFLLVNPGWNPQLNPKEDAYCRRSKEHYVDLMFNFFSRHPQVVGEHIPSTTRMISLVGVLRDSKKRFGQPALTEAKWRQAQESELLGHWELFPFHSSKDGITKHIHRCSWLLSCVRESALAALRFEPECLLAMSKEAWHSLKKDWLASMSWTDDVLGSQAVNLSYCIVPGRTRNTEVVAVARQFQRRPYKNDVLFEAVNRLRQVGNEAVPKTTFAETTVELRVAPEPREPSETQRQVLPYRQRQRSVRYYRLRMEEHHYVPRPNSQTELIERHLSSVEWKSAEQIHGVIQGEGDVLTLARIKQHLDWHAKRGRVEVEERTDPPDAPEADEPHTTGG